MVSHLSHFGVVAFITIIASVLFRHPPMNNSAFIFLKPHANNPLTQELVVNVLRERGITILKEGEFNGREIDENHLIDQHYYSIASKATLLKPHELSVPADKFSAEFGEVWDDVLREKRAFNALDAQREFNISAIEFNELWNAARKVKLGGGFYCAEIPVSSRMEISSSHPPISSIYTFNGFFMSMRSKFVAQNSSIHYYVVEFEPTKLSWADFRGKVLGPTDPTQAPADSLRGKIYTQWKDLGLLGEPNVSDNCVHASASPLEGLVEKLNWLHVRLDADPFGSAVLNSGISQETIIAWSRDPQVKGKSIFDQLEDLDAESCLKKMLLLAE